MNKILISLSFAALLNSYGSVEVNTESSTSSTSTTTSDSTEQKSTESVELEPIAKDTTPRVVGIGGIFFKSDKGSAINDWYSDNLGIKMTPYGANFEFRNANRPDEVNYLTWGTFPEETTYFAPSDAEFMINYRVQNLQGLLRKLKANGVTILDSVQKESYGDFVHILDADGNKIELWEPIDHILTEFGGETNK